MLIFLCMQLCAYAKLIPLGYVHLNRDFPGLKYCSRLTPAKLHSNATAWELQSHRKYQHCMSCGLAKIVEISDSSLHI